MHTVQDAAPPDTSLLARCRASGEYVDAYRLPIARGVGLADWIEAFYCTPLFRSERWILTLFGYPSSDAQARQLAHAEATRFAAWTLSERRSGEILLTDARESTRSWLAVEALAEGTLLWFGSAVCTRRRGADGQAQLSAAMRALLGLHERYSRALLRAGARRLQR